MAIVDTRASSLAWAIEALVRAMQTGPAQNWKGSESSGVEAIAVAVQGVEEAQGEQSWKWNYSEINQRAGVEAMECFADSACAALASMIGLAATVGEAVDEPFRA